jgi:uncharacterized protein (TIGR03435 family)
VGAVALAIPVIVGVVDAPSVRAQGPGTPKFEVASIRPNHSGSTSSDVGPPVGDHFSAINIYVRALIWIAYGVQDFRISGAPDWTETERFDITAKADRPSVTTEQYHLMLQALLADRFRLRVHHEAKESTVLALTVAGGGLKLRESDCPKGSSVPDPCKIAMTTDTAEASLKGRFVSMTELTSSLESITKRFVVDRTGLGGKYEVDLKWSPDFMLSDGTSGPSLSSALQEQAGLKLQAAKGQVDVLVVDHVERPSEN